MKMENKKVYFDSLTGLRFVAASMVFFHHFNPISEGGFLFKLIDELHVGVTIFFVLSGFLITYRYLDTLKTFSIQYFVNRFARIYPVWFFLTIITYLFKFFNEDDLSIRFFVELLLNLTLVKGFFSDFKFSGIGQGWTLTVEETFYFIFPFFLFFLKKIINQSFSLKLLFFGFSIFSFLFMGFFLVKLNFPSSFFENFNFVNYYTFFGRSFEFLSGSFLATLINKNVQNESKIFPYFTIIGFMSSLILVTFMSRLSSNGIGYGTIEGLIINNYFLPLFGIVPLFYGLIYEKSLISKILKSGIFSLLGKSSYTFYLIHLGFLSNLYFNFFDNILLFFFLCCIISIGIFMFFEEPINKKIRKLWN